MSVKWPLHTAHWGAFRAQVEAGRVVGVVPFERDPAPSPILEAIPAMLHGRTRIARPALRESVARHGPGAHPERRGCEPFVEVGWDRALDLVAAELRRVRDQHGHSGIFAGSYGWSSAGRFHHAKTHLQRFLSAFGGYTDQRHTYSYGAAQAILPHILGSAEAAQGPISDWNGILGRTELLVSFGGIPLKNAQMEAGGIAVHDLAARLEQARARGVRFVNISPVRDDLPPGLDGEWIPIVPGTDTALILALAHELMLAGREDRAFLDRCCVGYEVFVGHVLGRDDGTVKSAAWAAAITGIPAGRIRDLARQMAGSRCFLNMAWSLQRADHGEQPYWALITLAAMLGQIGQPGGGFAFGLGALGSQGMPRVRTPSPSLGGGKRAGNDWIPVARLTDMLLDPGGAYDFEGERRYYPDTRLIYWCGGNPFHHHQDLNRLVQGWRRPETVIIQEIWWTATARFADIVLPATTTMERNDIGASSRDRFIMAMKQLCPPVGEARDDFDIFLDLGHRLGIAESYGEGRTEMQWIEHLYETARAKAAAAGIGMPDFARFWAEGWVEMPEPDRPLVMLEAFCADPGRHPLSTPSGRIELFSERVAGYGKADCPGHAAWRAPREYLGAPLAARYPLHMLSNQPATRLHSQMDAGGISLRSKIAGREPIWLHPDDAARRGIAEGDVVRVFNDRGQTLAGARLTDGQRPGVVQFPTGAWFDPDRPENPASGLERHGNPNVLTRDQGSSEVTQGCAAQSALVEVEKYTGPLPEIAVHGPPRLLAWDDLQKDSQT